MNDLTFNLLKIVISVVAALIAYYVIPFLKEKVKEAKYKDLVEAVKIAVDAAEQTFKEGGMGKLKKEDVIKFITSYLNDNKIDISDDQLDRLIEAAVFQLNKGKK
jgi:LL-H family phage holin